MHAVFSKYFTQFCHCFFSLHFAQVEAIVQSGKVEEELSKLFQKVSTVRDQINQAQTTATQAQTPATQAQTLARPLHGDVNTIFAVLQKRELLKTSGSVTRFYTCGQNCAGGHISDFCPLKDGNVGFILLIHMFLLTQLAAKQNHQAATG